jgi:type II secretory pathway pseudopilin PulG
MEMERRGLHSQYFNNIEETMIKREAGFSLVELMITMIVFVFFIAAASQVFTGLLTQFKQQSKIAETNIEGIVGLEMLRQDVEHAGYGLPWYGLVAYNESSTNPYSLNDSTTTAAPRAVLSKNNATFSSPNNIFNGSDYLVIKAVNVGRNDACQKWTLLKAAPFTSPYNPRKWTPALTPPQGEDLSSTDRVIVLRPGSTDADGRTLVTSGSTFSTTFSSITSSPWPPADTSETRIVYGVDPDTDLGMPFNRADYVVRRFDSGGANITPGRCAPNTGVLEKATVNQGNGAFSYLPLLDCVADMQVIFGLDRNNNGIIGTYTDGDTDITWPSGTPDESADHADVTASFSTAANLRQRLKEVRVYILAHEGQRDTNYTYPNSTILVGDSALGASLGNTFNLSSKIGDPEYKYYRWKLYTIVLKPVDLR